MNTAVIDPLGIPLLPASSIDPVCGMTVMAEQASATLKFAGKQYFFCSGACQQKFQQNPARYLGRTEANVPAPPAADLGAPMQAAHWGALCPARPRTRFAAWW